MPLHREPRKGREKQRRNFTLQGESAAKNIRHAFKVITNFTGKGLEPYTLHPKAFGLTKKMDDPKLKLIGTTETLGKTIYWYVDLRTQKGTFKDRKN